MTAHSELVARLEGASEGSRELDVLIGSVNGYRNRFTGRLLSEALADPEMHDEAMQWEGVPYCTTSLDAALALAERVLPGWAVTMVHRPAIQTITATIFPEGDDSYGAVDDRAGRAYAKTLPLALCASILRATATQPSDDGEKT